MKRSILASLLTVFLSPVSLAQETILYATDFTTLAGWTVMTGCDGPPYVWAADATPATHSAGPFISPPASLNFNNGIDIGGEGSHGGADWTCGSVASPPIDITLALGEPRLRFSASWNMEAGCDWDALTLTIRSAGDNSLVHDFGCLSTVWAPTTWFHYDLPLDPAWGEIRIEFDFNTLDDWVNDGSGPFIDDLEVVDVIPIFQPACLGDGSGAACPCGNTGTPGAGCRNSTGGGGLLGASGTRGIAAADLVLEASQLPPGQFGTFLQGQNSVNGGLGAAFGDGLRCAGGALIRLQQAVSTSGGGSSSSIDVAAEGGVAPGDTRTYQLWYRDPLASACSTNFNFTNGIEVTWLP